MSQVNQKVYYNYRFILPKRVKEEVSLKKLKLQGLNIPLCKNAFNAREDNETCCVSSKTYMTNKEIWMKFTGVEFDLGILST